MAVIPRRPGPAGPFRVLRIIARLNIGGPALHATLLTERLNPARYESWLATGTEAPGEGNYLALHHRSLDRVVRVAGLGREIRGAADGAALIGLLRLIRRLSPHVVHTHTAKAGTLGRLAAVLARVPVVVHSYHGHVFRGYFRPTTTRVFLAIERALARRTDRLLTVSETVRTELLALGVGRPDQLRVLPLGLDLETLLRSETRRGELRAELGLAPTVPCLGIVARLVPIKAHEVLLAGVAELARRGSPACLLVVGDGERRAELETLASRLGLAGRVRFLGWRRDLDRIYADLDVVVLTSRNEGSPVSLIEAMAAARPVVATRVGGVPDLVEEGMTGRLVPPDDPSALAAALAGLLADPAGAAVLGVAGRKRVVEHFTADRLLDDVDRLYGELLQAKLPGGGGW